mmetsp:Transcript_28528/g.70950  ORF Transcript_28528/g.70950 Transcript_28528/m.70950 type:complete len:84 (+) Transcript_28528:218-469(+)
MASKSASLPEAEASASRIFAADGDFIDSKTVGEDEFRAFTSCMSGDSTDSKAVDETELCESTSCLSRTEGNSSDSNPEDENKP